jgi:hypothetical protein
VFASSGAADDVAGTCAMPSGRGGGGCGGCCGGGPHRH